MRILIVDDEAPVLDLLRRLCEREGHEVSTARSSLEALGLLQASLFDLLITDIVMPGLDGVSLVRKARALHADLLALVITGQSGPHSLDEVLAAGATDLLLKPLRAPELCARLRLAADLKQTIDEWKARRLDVRRAGAQIIASLQRELEEARQQVARLSAGMPQQP